MAVPEYATAAEVLARLRMTDSSVDAEWVGVCTDGANDKVDRWLQRDDDPLVAPYPSLVRRAAVGVAIRLYRFRDTESNVDEAWGAEGVAVSLPRDPMAGYVDMLADYRHGSAWSPQ